MTGRSVIHDTFTIERKYKAAPSRVFAAFASVEARKAWIDICAAEAGEEAAAAESGYQSGGGRERFHFRHNGTRYRCDARCYDFVPHRRIVYAYELYTGDVRISVSVATLEFAQNGDGTVLTWTEQGTYLAGADWPLADWLNVPARRRGHAAEMLTA